MSLPSYNLHVFGPTATVGPILQSFAANLAEICDRSINAAGMREMARHQAKALLDVLLAQPEMQKPLWQSELRKLYPLLAADSLQPSVHFDVPFRVFAKGNSKLPFMSFGTLPIVTCPGAGDCVQYCYSIKAWAYPCAFARQVQNMWLLRWHPDVILNELDALPALGLREYRTNGTITLRLYTDGDFSSVDDIEFWCRALKVRPHLRAYCYTKSVVDFGSYWATKGRPSGIGLLPENLTVNLSPSGASNPPEHFESLRSRLPDIRGNFLTVDMGRLVRSNEHGTRDMGAQLRAALALQDEIRIKGTVFPCPGSCGDCTPAGPACASPRFRGVTIAIAKH